MVLKVVKPSRSIWRTNLRKSKSHLYHVTWVTLLFVPLIWRLLSSASVSKIWVIFRPNDSLFEIFLLREFNSWTSGVINLTNWTKPTQAFPPIRLSRERERKEYVYVIHAHAHSQSSPSICNLSPFCWFQQGWWHKATFCKTLQYTATHSFAPRVMDVMLHLMCSRLVACV